MANQLSKHAIFCVCPEADVLYNYLLRDPSHNLPLKKKHLCRLLRDKKFVHWRLAEDSLRKILNAKKEKGEKFLDILDLFRKTHFPASSYIIFKYNFMVRLSPYFETKKATHTFYWLILQRNPYALFASQKRTVSPDTKRAMAKNVILFCQKVQAFTLAINKNTIKNSIIINYEDLITSFASTLNNIFRFIGLKNVPVKSVSKEGRIKQFMSADYMNMHPSIDLPPDSRSIDSWKEYLSAFEIYCIHSRLSDKKQRNRRKIHPFKMKYVFPFLGTWIGAYYRYWINLLKKMVSPFL